MIYFVIACFVTFMENMMSLKLSGCKYALHKSQSWKMFGVLTRYVMLNRWHGGELKWIDGQSLSFELNIVLKPVI